MKHRLLFVLIAAMTVSGASAQGSLTVLNLDLNPWGSAEQSIIQANGSVENTYGTSALDVKVRRITVDTVPGTENYFCWEQCYNPATDESPTSMNIAPGNRIDQFYADYKPHGIAGTSTLIYCFFDENNEADSVCVTVRFTASPVGVQDVFMGDESGISASYPNPAIDRVSINYALKLGWNRAEIVLYSMLGSPVKKLFLTEDQGTLKLDVSTLPEGMYFYTLVVDGMEAGTRKMLIRN